MRSVSERHRKRALALLLAGCAACATPEAPVRAQGAWGAEACPEGTRFHRSERYWEEFATWPAQWCTLPDGTRHGPWTEWFEDGHVRRMGLYVNGVPDGRWLSWKERGWRPFGGGERYEKIELQYSQGVLVRSTRTE